MAGRVAPWRKQASSETGHGKDWPWHQGSDPTGLQPPCAWASRPPRSVAFGTVVSSCPAWALGCAPGDSDPAQKEADAGGAATTGWTGPLGCQQGPLDTGWPSGQTRERRLTSGLGKSPRSVGAGPAGPRPGGPQNPGSAPGPSLTPRETLHHWTHSRGHHVTSMCFSRNASALLTAERKTRR